MNSCSKSNSWISPATRSFVRQAWKSQAHAPWDFLHSFFYARWPYTYIALANADHGLIQQVKKLLKLLGDLVPRIKSTSSKKPFPGEATGTIADIYHGKVLPIESAQNIIMINQPVNLPDLEQVIPFERARALILENPDHVLQVKCPCRVAKKSPCEPLEVCLVVGEPFTSLIHQNYPSRSRWITAQEACNILAEEDDRGRVHHAFFSEMMLGRFFAICNCCSCCCTAMQAHQRGTPMLAPSGYLAQVNELQCSACFECEPYCHFGALQQAGSSISIDPDLCMGCGVCLSKCPMGAISLRLEPAKGVPLEIFDLIEDGALPAH
jgi:ferredoxin